MLYVMFSFLTINILHGYLIFRSSDRERNTISLNAATDERSLYWYRMGHGVNGLFLILATLHITKGSLIFHILLALVLSVINEWLQALVPARGKTMWPHNVLAVLMGLSMIILVLCLSLSVASKPWLKTSAWLLCSLAFLVFFYIKFPTRPYSWVAQFIAFNSLYIQLFLLTKFM